MRFTRHGAYHRTLKTSTAADLAGKYGQPRLGERAASAWRCH
jgi:hypothetical protein